MLFFFLDKILYFGKEKRVVRIKENKICIGYLVDKFCYSFGM